MKLHYLQENYRASCKQNINSLFNPVLISLLRLLRHTATCMCSSTTSIIQKTTHSFDYQTDKKSESAMGIHHSFMEKKNSAKEASNSEIRQGPQNITHTTRTFYELIRTRLHPGFHVRSNTPFTPTKHV